MIFISGIDFKISIKSIAPLSSISLLVIIILFIPDLEKLRSDAIEWQATRGARSGRVAWQFFVDLAGRSGVQI